MASFELEKLQTATKYSIYCTRIVDTCDMMRAIFNFNEVSRGLREISRCAVWQFCKRAWGKVFDKSLIFTYRSIYSPGFVSNCSRLRIMWANCEFKFNSLLLFLPRWSRTKQTQCSALLSGPGASALNAVQCTHRRLELGLASSFFSLNNSVYHSHDNYSSAIVSFFSSWAKRKLLFMLKVIIIFIIPRGSQSRLLCISRDWCECDAEILAV